MKSSTALALLGSVAIALGATSFASAACRDDVRALHGQMVTGSTAGANAADNNSPNPSETESSSTSASSGDTATEELDQLAATGNSNFDTAIGEAWTAARSGDETACMSALERARGAM